MSIQWQDEQLPITELKHPERNVRVHGEKQISELRRSLKLSGQRRPLIIDDGNTVLVGNGLLMAMRAEGYETIWVHTWAQYDRSPEEKDHDRG